MGARARRSFVAAACLLALQCAALRAAADPAAEALFRAGRAAAVRGDYAGAREKFEESRRLEPAPGTDLNLAICEEHLGNPVVAWELYQRVLHAVNPNDPRAAIARRGAADLDAVLSRLTFVPATDLPRGASVREAEREYGAASFDVELRFLPGVHHFTVEAPGRLPRSLVAGLEEGAAKRLLIEPGAIRAQAAGSVTARVPLRSRSLRAWSIVTFGAAASLTTVSAIAGYGALRQQHAVDQNCDARGCSDAGLAAARRGQSLETVATATFVGALAAAGAGVSLLLFDGKGASSEPHLPNTISLGPSLFEAAWNF